MEYTQLVNIIFFIYFQVFWLWPPYRNKTYVYPGQSQIQVLNIKTIASFTMSTYALRFHLTKCN